VQFGKELSTEGIPYKIMKRTYSHLVSPFTSFQLRYWFNW